MTADYYAHSGRRWATGAELVYRPVAAELVAMSPHPLAGRTVLDAGAGTGVASSALTARRARVLAVDLSAGMLAWSAPTRPPCAVADIRALPLASRSVDDTVASFVLNHLAEPVAGFTELARVTRPGGALLASVFSNSNRTGVRDQIDALAASWGWRAPAWYGALMTTAMPLLGSQAGMAAAVTAGGMAVVRIDERPVDVRVTEPGQLVSYRLGHPVFAGWLDAIGEQRAQDFARAAAEAIRPVMEPYRPLIVFLSARVPG